MLEQDDAGGGAEELEDEDEDPDETQFTCIDIGGFLSSFNPRHCFAPVLDASCPWLGFSSGRLQCDR